VLVAGLLAGSAAAPAARAATTAPEAWIFPVVGGATYTDDFGDPRPQGRHEGNDLVAPRGTPVVACSGGVVRLGRSRSGGYMIWLVGKRHEWLYIHLSNDRTAGNDNRGGPATAYAPGLRTGMTVHAGQEIGYVGNSGDADSTVAHLHFEEHSPSGAAHDPYRHLRAAPVPLLSTLSAAPIAPVVRGRFVALRSTPTGPMAAVAVRTITVGARTVAEHGRVVVVREAPAVAAALATARAGQRVTVTMAPQRLTRAAQPMGAGTWTAAAVTG
jgi:hypothetical protein